MSAPDSPGVQDGEQAAGVMAVMPLSCDHHESLYGRCVACGRTWAQQAADEKARREMAAVGQDEERDR